MEGYHILTLCAVAFIFLSISVDLSEGNCQDCCKGKNNKCRAYGPRINRPNATTCFCDEDCYILGDCCTNYQSLCKQTKTTPAVAVDCVLKDFGDWSPCSETCGWGYKTRIREIEQEPQNGGKKCGPRKQKTYCRGKKCKGRRASQNLLQEISETAKVIPAQFGSWRKNKLYNPFNDIRSNLFKHYGQDKMIKRPAYCAEFTIVESRKACQSPLTGNWAKGLQEKNVVCVECQPSAMKKGLGVRCKGQGVYDRPTRWNAVTVAGCHGKWKMTSQRKDCSCDPQKSTSFIFI